MRMRKRKKPLLLYGDYGMYRTMCRTHFCAIAFAERTLKVGSASGTVLSAMVASLKSSSKNFEKKALSSRNLKDREALSVKK